METTFTINYSHEHIKKDINLLKDFCSSIKPENIPQLLDEITQKAHHLFAGKVAHNFQLSTNYDFEDFLKEIFCSLSNIKSRYSQFLRRMNTIHKKGPRKLHYYSNEFEEMIHFWLIQQAFKLEHLVEICYWLFLNNYQIPFSFLSAHIINMFYFPMSQSLDFLATFEYADSAQDLERFVSEFIDPKTDPNFSPYYQDIIKYTTYILRDSDDVDKEKLKIKEEELHLYILPCRYDAFKFTDYKGNIYISEDEYPHSNWKYWGLLLSVISLTQEIRQRNQSIQFNYPQGFSPPDFNFHHGKWLETSLFGYVIHRQSFTGEEATKILTDPQVEKNIVPALKALLFENKDRNLTSTSLLKFGYLPKD